MAINIIAIHHLKFYLKKLSKNVATCLTLTALGLIIIATNELQDFNHVLGCTYEKNLHL